MGGTLWQRGPVSPAAPNHFPPVHVCCGISRIHTPNVRTQRAAITMRVHCSVVEVIVPAVISAEAGIIFVGGYHERSTASPAAHQFGRDPFLLLRCIAV